MKKLVFPMAFALSAMACGGSSSKDDNGTLQPVARTLVSRTFMGTVPTINGFLSPAFDPASYPAWLSLADGNPLVQVELPSTPSGLPALQLGKADSGGAMAAGYAQGGPGPLTGSVWVGRPSSKKFDDYSAPMLGMYGIFPAAQGATQTETEIDLTPVAGSDVTMSGIVWRKYQFNTQSELLGRGLLLVFGSPTLYVTGPLLQSAAVTAFSDEPVSPSRAATPEERGLLQSIRERSKPRHVEPRSRPTERALPVHQ